MIYNGTEIYTHRGTGVPAYPDRRSRVYFCNVVDPYLIAVTKRLVPSLAVSLMRSFSASAVHVKLCIAMWDRT